MSQELPPDFDADRYAAAYPDVALSGLSAKQHYLRFGKVMGRDPRGKNAAPRSAAVQGSPVKDAPVKSLPSSATTKTEARPVSSKSENGPIIERPSDYDPADIVPRSAPPKRNAPENGIYTLETIAAGASSSVEQADALWKPLAAYARMFSLEVPQGISSDSLSPTCGASRFQTGETRIESAWFPASHKLRIMIGGGREERTFTAGSSIRAYQAEPTSPGNLRMAGLGVQVPKAGPLFHDLELVHSFMPLLLELSDANGVTQEISLVPFPSLLPGGPHGAELKAMQTEANAMDSFWSMSEALLGELLAPPGSPARSITCLMIHEATRSDNSQGQEPLGMRDWIRALFGTAFRDADSGRPSDGLTLVLPSGGLPTITVLVSRRIELTSAREMVPPFLVADSLNGRPRWSVALPVDQQPAPSLPAVQRSGAKRGGRQKPTPVHVAIVPAASETRLPKSSSLAAGSALATPLSLSVVLDASDADRTKSLVTKLKAEMTGGQLELFARLSDSQTALRSALDDVRDGDGWTELSRSTDLRDIASIAQHELILTIDDRVQIDSRGTIDLLIAIIHGNGSNASASCLLVGETIFKKEVVLQPGSGGLFPSHVSFASSPSLGFHEPDVSEALPNLTYPVVANTYEFCVWRSQALAKLPRLSGPVPATVADIRLGLDLLAAGYSSLCTTLAAVRVTQPAPRRDAIDPVGSAYLQPADWEDIFRRVTVLRQLF